ncbi:putative protein TRANSPARENT TESTA 12-like [Capsicum annuum]|nr:putative protein TRANSPARENT TESTA 12-like [Capsicum annuum]
MVGWLKNPELAVDAISTSLVLQLWVLMIILGFNATISVRVSNELGAGCPKTAKFSVVVAIITSTLIGIVFAVEVTVGAGWQYSVAIINIVCYYIVGLPLGSYLGYIANIGVKGIWTGMLCILCGYALKILDTLNVKDKIFDYYIVKRWTKDATNLMEIEIKDSIEEIDPKAEVRTRYKHLCKTFIQIASEASEFREGYELAGKYANEII